jgi:hypothetical protein
MRLIGTSSFLPDRVRGIAGTAARRSTSSGVTNRLTSRQTGGSLSCSSRRSRARTRRDGTLEEATYSRLARDFELEWLEP